MRNLVKWIGLVGLAGSTVLGAACTATGGRNVFGEGGAGGEEWSGGKGGASGTTGPGTGGDDSTGAFVGTGVGSGAGGGAPVCDTDANVDDDGDGLSEMQGDCNDCDKNVSPQSVEVVGDAMNPEYNPSDEDCDGTVDEAVETCDQALVVDSNDPFDAARAVELCKIAAPGSTDWGVVSANWVMADGSPATSDADFHRGHGNLSGFGPNVTPRAGSKLFAVSSGTGRQPTDVGYASPGGFDKGYSSGHPQGFPKESPACPGTLTGTPRDATAVELEIRVPQNANGFSFDFYFYTYEWPVFMCSQYNDFFVAILSPIPMGQPDGNISFDMQGNPISVNNAFMNVCGCSGGPPCLAGGKTFTCPLGTMELIGTGFEDHAGTGWLKTQAPATPGSTIRIRWGAYDSGDGVLDSTALVDNWAWIAEAGTTVGTAPIPPEDPK
ncbi:hypothetical protein [Polyangium spumosum]|uniref:Uncharacterized protein n=1 Tax=Polyangium spumosum TaxID=889282 RepID=A0A6N7PR66_9BACT|nr:hypothetical protein [Polyangium spumosum]MRG94429.1 hypothetical protein [Polyangium spumosum]